jgi:hypothetical protein
MISKKLCHMVRNRLQRIMGYIDLAEIQPDEEKRKAQMLKAKDQIRDLDQLLEQKIQK